MAICENVKEINLIFAFLKHFQREFVKTSTVYEFNTFLAKEFTHHSCHSRP